MKTVLVTGAGGFIGGHLVKRLLDDGHNVRAADAKPLEEWWQVHPNAANVPYCDVGEEVAATNICYGVDEVYNLAADMGGMGFISSHKLDCMLSVRSSTSMLLGAAFNQVRTFFYSSSACVYPDYLQSGRAYHLAERTVYPAMPEDGYGWEKLFTERMCHHFNDAMAMNVRVGRYHNVAGPHGSWTGGREKAPAAICRKVATAALTSAEDIEIWGDGEATRTFMCVDDCVEGTLRVAAGEYADPVNIGSDEIVSINELTKMIMDIAGYHVPIRHVPGPQGVRGRSSDNTLIRERYDWEPSTKLRTWLPNLYAWVYDQVNPDERMFRESHIKGTT
jgi:GDP-D-mannose 3',5'-epimerase